MAAPKRVASYTTSGGTTTGGGYLLAAWGLPLWLIGRLRAPPAPV